MLSNALWAENMRKFVLNRCPRRRLKAQTMLPSSTQEESLSQLSVSRLIYAMDFMESSACSCSTAAPKPWMQALQYTWNRREPLTAASQLEKTRIGAVASSARISRANVYFSSVNTNLTSFRRR